MFRSIQLLNFLSFGPESEAIDLAPLNILIGPNGSGKSNLLEAISLMQSAPGRLTVPIREGGGVEDWLWKGGKGLPTASLEVLVDPLLPTAQDVPLRYRFDFTTSGSRFEIVDERIENAEAYIGHTETYFYYRYEDNHPVLNVKGDDDTTYKPRTLRREDIDPEKSILAQRRDPDSYPEITRLANLLENIRLYRDWSMGRFTAPRLPQPASLSNKWLDADASNLGLVLNRLKRYPETKIQMLEMFRAIYAEAVDFDIMIDGGRVQVFVQEKRFNVPATRLSDGTLRYLFLLAILFDPDPPPLICIDEPELGLHPDLINHVAEGLRHAAQHTQLIVTTHSTTLIDAFTDEPEVILVCEKEAGVTQIQRLDAEQLQPWLKQYRLGSLWSKGEIGGVRW